MRGAELTNWTDRRLICAAAILGFAGSFAIVGPAKRVLAFANQHPICVGAAQAVDADEAVFLDANGSAMTKMMAGMTIKPAGDVDRDFMAMMIPHHQGAIEMAQAELRYGRNERLGRIAQEIIVTQQQEIAAMRLALGLPLPPSAPSPDQISSARSNRMQSPSAPEQEP
jgi:hypothetical protein